MNEAETRAEYIDKALAAAGWGVVEGSRIRREYPITPGRLEGRGRRAKPLIADYVLEYRNTKLAMDEAKAWDEELTEGVAQTKNYAGKLAVRFAYATNGRGNDESNWRGIMEYFAPAVQLGLTATPKRKENADTYRYFGKPVFVYSLKEGINDGFLTPFRVRQIATTLDEYVYTQGLAAVANMLF